MATLRDIKRRIKGVSNTQQITKAMKMVAAAKLRRAQENIINARPYSKKLNELLGRLLAVEKNIVSPLVEEREIKKIAIILITSDNGLCGAFNMNILRTTEDLIKNEYSYLNKDQDISLYCLGKKGFEYFNRRNLKIAENYTGFYKELKFDLSTKILAGITNLFVKKEFDRVILVYNEFRSVMQQKLVVQQLLPIKIESDEDINSSQNIDFLFEPDKTNIISNLLPKYLNAHLWKALLESYASELGARMTAMDLATENAKELIKELKLQYNKERQATITTEILEIVSGAEALKKG